MPTSYSPEKHPSGPQRPNSDEDEHHHDLLPPPYTGPSSSASPASSSLNITTPPSNYVGLPRLNYSLYVPPESKLSNDKTTITIYTPAAGTTPQVLHKLIQEQASIPPRIMVRVQGSSNDQTEFDIRVNLMPLFVPQDGSSEKWTYLRTIADGEVGFRGGFKESTEPVVRGGLDEWVRRYCDDEANRQFLIERSIVNLDVDYLEGRLHALIASTGYKGHVSVSFPMTYNKVILKSSSKGKGFLATMSSLFSSSKKYEIVKVMWPYASVRPGGDGRRFTVMSEETWWSAWRDAIRYAVCSKRKGWVTIEDQLEFLMNPQAAKGIREWGRDLM